jgi:1-acyl-sn-glycerol-3-phosphate acyltransferase
MYRILKVIFFAFIVKPIVLVGLGLNIRGKNNLPLNGPAVIAANHNSHLDTMVLMSLYPLSMIHKVRPVAAADYFLRNKLLAWFSLNIIGIIPIERNGSASREEQFHGCHKALDDAHVLLIFPEGSRGNPEEMSRLKKGIHFLLSDRKDAKVTPVVMHGLGRSLPRGEALFVPFNCDVVIGEPLLVNKKSTDFLSALSVAYDDLMRYCITRSL